MNKFLLLFFVVFTSSFFKVNAQTQLTYFSSRNSDKNSNPFEQVKFNNQFLFPATTEDSGRELWISDGTEQNTRLLKDIFPGNGGGIETSFKESSVVLGDKLFFIANDGENGRQLWATQGTAQTTKRVTNLPKFNAFSLTLVGNHIFFLIQENNALQVWRSDGTNEGTALIKKDLSIMNSPSFEGAVNNLFFFTFQPNGSNNTKVWRSDGTESGTFPLTQELDGNGAGSGGTSSLSQYMQLNNELYFVVRSSSIFSSSNSVGIMKTDGSLKNTVPVKAIHPGNTRLIDFADVIRIKNKLYFSFFEADLNRLFIWESDGTEAGTKKIYDETSSKYFVPSNLSTDGTDLIFTSKNAKSETALLKLRLHNYQIEEIKTLDTNPVKPSMMIHFYSYLIKNLTQNTYLILEPAPKFTAWFSDLTAANTNLVANVKFNRDAFVFNENVFFSNNTEQEGYELWKADLAFTNTRLVKNINQSKYGLENQKLTVLKDKILFKANDGKSGVELWVYNRTTRETKLLKDIRPGTSSSYPDNLFHFNDKIYFTAMPEGQRVQLWRTDGTDVTVANEINLEGGTNYLNFFTKRQDKLYFVTRFNNKYFLCKTDGTKTEKIKDLGLNPYGVAISVKEMLFAGNYLYFTTQGAGENLWRSDGTESGTIKLQDFYSANYLTSLDDKIYLSARQSFTTETELWQSDGSMAGTKMVKDIGNGYASDPMQLVNFNGKLVFSAFTKESGREFWKSDGTAEGTVQIADINPGAASSASTFPAFAVSGNWLYFSAFNSSHGTELWKSDGTANGTMLVRDINPGPTGSFPRNLTAQENKVFFSAFTDESGTELWETQGSSVATKQIFDLDSGTTGSMPSNFTFVEKELIFVAEKSNTGLQLWEYTEENVTGINDFIQNSGLNIFPNPASDYLYIQNENKRLESIQIFNLQGQKVPVNKELPGKIFVRNLSPGIYFLVAHSDKKIIVTKFVKK